MSMPFHQETGDGGAGVFTRDTTSPLLTWILGALLFGSLFVLGMDLHDVINAEAPTAVVSVPVTVPDDAPSSGETSSEPAGSARRAQPSHNWLGLRRPMAFSYAGGGVVAAKGTIDATSLQKLQAMLREHGDSMRTISLNSPGGSLDDAIVMARFIRSHGLDTRVDGANLCASSCPLLLAGGVQRTIEARAQIGVHQFYASTDLSEEPAQAMIDAQLMTARIARHLTAMGVDPALWFNALSTPPQMLYYLTPGEMARYRLSTVPNAPAAEDRDRS